MEHFCANILKSGHWPKDEMSFEDFLFFSSGGHLVQRSRTIAAILDFQSQF